MCPDSERIVTTRNGRYMVTCICSECGISKTQFIKNDGGYRQTGRGTSKNGYTCGLDPKNKPYSMKKCLDMKQVRYWGKEKIDPEVLALGSDSDMNKKRMNLISQRIPLNAALKKLKSDLLYTNKRDTVKIKEIKDQAAEIIKKRDVVNKKIQNLDAKLGKPVRKRLEIPKDDFYYDPSIDKRYKALIKKEFEIPKSDFYYDPSIDERYKALMKKNKKKTTKKKTVKREFGLRLLKKDLEKGVDFIMDDLKRQIGDLTPSEIKTLRKQIGDAY